MTEDEWIMQLASLCDDQHPKSWNDIMNKPVAETIRQLDADMIITEMALPLKDFKRRVDGLRFQLIENWCLCEYCHLYDPTNVNFGHWISEFAACVKNLQDFEIKGKISKTKTIHKMFITDYDYDQERKILFIIRDKFDNEKLMDMNKRTAVAGSFVNAVNDLIAIISNTQASIADYVQTVFGFQQST